MATQVHVYTLREEPQFVLPHLGSSAAPEAQLLMQVAYVSAAFCDSPDRCLEHLAEALPTLHFSALTPPSTSALRCAPAAITDGYHKERR